MSLSKPFYIMAFPIMFFFNFLMLSMKLKLMKLKILRILRLLLLHFTKSSKSMTVDVKTVETSENAVKNHYCRAHLTCDKQTTTG